MLHNYYAYRNPVNNQKLIYFEVSHNLVEFPNPKSLLVSDFLHMQSGMGYM